MHTLFARANAHATLECYLELTETGAISIKTPFHAIPEFREMCLYRLLISFVLACFNG